MDLFHEGDEVSYATFMYDEVLYHGTVLGPGWMHKDDDGDGPVTKPYKVYPIEYEGGRGVGGHWPEDSMRSGWLSIGSIAPKEAS